MSALGVAFGLSCPACPSSCLCRYVGAVTATSCTGLVLPRFILDFFTWVEDLFDGGGVTVELKAQSVVLWIGFIFLICGILFFVLGCCRCKDRVHTEIEIYKDEHGGTGPCSFEGAWNCCCCCCIFLCCRKRERRKQGHARARDDEH